MVRAEPPIAVNMATRCSEADREGTGVVGAEDGQLSPGVQASVYRHAAAGRTAYAEETRALRRTIHLCVRAEAQAPALHAGQKTAASITVAQAGA